MARLFRDKRIDEGRNPSRVELAVSEARPKHFTREMANFLIELHQAS
jgi:hypothetical protein